MGNSPEVKEAIKRVFEELKKLSPEEFKKELEKHKDGDISLALQELWSINDEEIRENDKPKDEKVF